MLQVEASEVYLWQFVFSFWTSTYVLLRFRHVLTKFHSYLWQNMSAVARQHPCPGKTRCVLWQDKISAVARQDLSCAKTQGRRPSAASTKAGGRLRRQPAFVDSLMRLVGGRGKAKQGRLQGKTNSAEPRQSKPGGRAQSAKTNDTFNDFSIWARPLVIKKVRNALRLLRLLKKLRNLRISEQNGIS